MPEDTTAPEAQDTAVATATATIDAEPHRDDTPAVRQPAEVVRPGESAITLQPGQRWWTSRQKDTLLANYKQDERPGDEDLMRFLHLCLVTQLDPFRNEIYFIGRRDGSAPGGRKFTAQTGIDGFRHIAERTGEYGGRVATQWCGPDGEWRDVWVSDKPPAAARVIVKRRGIESPFVGIATYAEFVPLTQKWEGSGNNRHRTDETEPMGLWKKMPAHMLAKCAEAQAIRAAFPRQLGSLYVTEEMHQADAAAEARIGVRDRKALNAWQREHGVEIGPEIVTAEVQYPPREQMLEELANQAKIMGKTLAQWCTRWTAAHKQNPEDARDRDLWDLVTSRRDMVAERAAETGETPYLAQVTEPTELPVEAVAEAQEAPATAVSEPQADETAVSVVESAEPRVVDVEAVESETDLFGATAEPAQGAPRHTFVGDDPEALCGAPGCDRTYDDPVHL